ncbi:MAG TPA: uroporphyrinogen-III C-methyltransferase, partial [Pirellulales bacterium]|nr:uroporphyrinogen-III C-methyltransferase [Pirellulales bacterium]
MPQHAASKVYLVGGGPGDPGLLTLRGAECLARADVVLYDYLVNPRILRHAPPQAKLVCLGRHGVDHVWRQDEIDRRLVELAQAGKTVVRLKGGDPALFGHLVEEVAALRAAQIEYEIVPGITAAAALASHAGIPLTRRDAASAVALVTGRESDDKQQPLDFAHLAAFPGTLVFYMGVTTVREWAGALVAAGKPADTPVAVVWRASQPEQRVLRTRLALLADDVERARLRPPALFVVGPTAAAADDLDWFSRRALFGASVLVPRPTRADDPLTRELEQLGAKVVAAPAIEIGPPADLAPLDGAIERLGSYRWLVFSSANGVEALLERVLATGRDMRAFAGVKLAAIGPGTAEALAGYHLRADLVPPEFRAESLADALAPQAAGGRCLLVRASRGREVLADRLRAAGATVDQVVAYSSIDAPGPHPVAARLLAEGSLDWIAVTSSAIARS